MKQKINEKNLSRPKKARSVEELLYNCPKNQIVGDNLIRAWTIINRSTYKKIVCSISGGSDSDVMLDIVWRCDKDNKVTYVWFNTGLEYQATKDHLRYLEKKYGIEIVTYNAIKPIPTACREYGLPFLNKQPISEYISRLQKHGFEWKDEPYEVLIKKYPKCKAALDWWCNRNKTSRFNIEGKKYLKEFLIENPPTFKISQKCCKYAKKDVAHKLIDEGGYDLNIMGVRKSEGGIRSTSYKNCFDDNYGGVSNYRPLFWYKNGDKADYVEAYAIENSKCYTEYGLTRTGCAGCPFNLAFEDELEVIKTYEPKLYKACENIFGKSYEYTRKYKEFAKKMKEKEKNKV